MQNLMLISLLVRNFGKESDISTCGFVLATHRNLLSNNDIAACTLYIHIAIIVPAVMIHIETKYAENPKIAQVKVHPLQHDMHQRHCKTLSKYTLIDLIC